MDSPERSRDDRSRRSSGSVALTIPALAFSEVVLGRVVGRGGFSVVNEIRDIRLEEVYDVDADSAAARQHLANSCRNNETKAYRYVLKTLRHDLPEDEYTKGIVDLAVEARFLAKLVHPNIIAMRATANSDPLETKFFVILDRLVSTLDLKIASWRKDIGRSMGIWLGPCIGYCCAKKHILHQLWIERIHVARDIASAIQYLHDQNIIYRDLKPDNLGFDHEGQIKLFDFGLAKRLHPDDRNTSSGLYMLTGNTGSLRYMAPEVALGQPYDLRVDTYSFGILFWQLCSLTTPYAGYSCKMHSDLVVGKGYRPKPDRSWPSSWRQLMKSCWSGDIYTRPDFTRVVEILQNELDELYREDDANYDNIRAKRKKKKAFIIQDRQSGLDIDTRIISSPISPVSTELTPSRRHDMEVV